jgi:hypothetical protein
MQIITDASRNASGHGVNEKQADGSYKITVQSGNWCLYSAMSRIMRAEMGLGEENFNPLAEAAFREATALEMIRSTNPEEQQKGLEFYSFLPRTGQNVNPLPEDPAAREKYINERMAVLNPQIDEYISQARVERVKTNFVQSPEGQKYESASFTADTTSQTSYYHKQSNSFVIGRNGLFDDAKTLTAMQNVSGAVTQQQAPAVDVAAQQNISVTLQRQIAAAAVPV